MLVKNNRLTLVLLTHSFPYAFGEQFLETEIKYLAARFQHIILVPFHNQGVARPVPDNIEVDTSLAKRSAKGLSARVLRAGIASLGSGLFYREIMARPLTLMQWPALVRAVVYTDKFRQSASWLRDFMRRRGLMDAIFYTYWLGPQTLAVRQAKKRYPAIKLISRVHEGDLYEYRFAPPYLPFRQHTLCGVDRVFAISEHGRRYLVGRYPSVAHCEVSRLGVNDPGFLTPFHADEKFHVVSCSSLEARKRVELLIEGLKLFAGMYLPHLLIEWHHLGDGPLRTSLEALAKQELPAKVQWCFHGRLPNRQVIEFYRTHPVDVFVNVSESEGIPVSIMEAQSCGIPVIATAVGGVPEIVTNENGLLLDSTPSLQAIADALAQFAARTADVSARRKASSQRWRSMYHAETNYNAFIDRLIELFG
jgi:glycosyltransferase involved in cell wall biosynthesis